LSLARDYYLFILVSPENLRCKDGWGWTYCIILNFSDFESWLVWKPEHGYVFRGQVSRPEWAADAATQEVGNVSNNVYYYYYLLLSDVSIL
jgi:hypothetical protein